MFPRNPPTAKCPFTSERRDWLLHMFENHGHAALAEAMYYLAKEDLQLHDRLMESNDTDKDDQRTKLKTSLEKLVADKSDCRYLCSVLCTVDADVMKSLIRGTIAYDYNSGKIKNKILQSDETPGAYILAVGIEERHVFLNRNEYTELRDLMLLYHDFDEKISAGKLPSTCRGFEKIIQIEAAPNKDPASLEKARMDVTAGILELVGRYTKEFSEELRDRIPTDLDDADDVYQQQTPLGVGCSDNLGIGVKSHTFASVEASTPLPLILMCRCLSVMGFSPYILALPIIKIFHVDQLELAEIALTMLTGSLVTDGGFNVVQPGTHGFGEKNQWGIQKATEELILTDWFLENIKAADAFIKMVYDVVEGDTIQKMKDLQILLEEDEKEAEKLNDDLDNLEIAISKKEDEIVQLTNHTARFVQATEDLKLQLRLIDAVAEQFK